MSKLSSNRLWLGNLDYTNLNNYKTASTSLNKLFITNFKDEACTALYFHESVPNPFFREIYKINNLLEGASSSNFKIFFKKLQIDTPEVLNKTPSLKRFSGLTPLKRLVLHLSRSGKKIKASKLIILSFCKIIDELKSVDFTKTSLTWREIHLLLTATSTNGLTLNKNFKTQSLGVNEFIYIKHSNIFKNVDYTINSILKQNFKKFNYLFSFYIYKVDKQIYKNSRGRSGKYTFVWKYVAPYKRHFLILHWLMKEVRISAGKTLKDRIYNTLQSFIFTTYNTWIWKIKKFSLNYVYYNLRKTLGETYKTSMR
jgi:hypothetical protein